MDNATLCLLLAECTRQLVSMQRMKQMTETHIMLLEERVGAPPHRAACS